MLTEVLSIRSTGTGPNFVRGDVLHRSLAGRIQYAYQPDKQDANKYLLKLLGTINDAVQQALSYIVCVNFYMCESLAAPMILEAAYCNKFVRNIRPGNEIIELADKAALRILCLDPLVRRRAPQKDARPLTGHEKSGKASSMPVQSLSTIDIPKSQGWFPFHAWLHGIVIIQPERKRF